MATTAMTREPVGASTGELIQPFSVNIPEGALEDLRQRIATTRWPDKETIADQSQGSRWR